MAHRPHLGRPWTGTRKNTKTSAKIFLAGGFGSGSSLFFKLTCGSESCPRKAKKPSRKTRQSRRWPMVWRSRDERRTTLRRSQDLHIPLRDELCRVRQGHDRLEPFVRQDVRWWWPIGYNRCFAETVPFGAMQDRNLPVFECLCMRV